MTDLPNQKPGPRYVLVRGGLVQNDPGIPVFDMDVVEDAPVEEFRHSQVDDAIALWEGMTKADPDVLAMRLAQAGDTDPRVVAAEVVEWSHEAREGEPFDVNLGNAYDEDDDVMVDLGLTDSVRVTSMDALDELRDEDTDHDWPGTLSVVKARAYLADRAEADFEEAMS